MQRPCAARAKDRSRGLAWLKGILAGGALLLAFAEAPAALAAPTPPIPQVSAPSGSAPPGQGSPPAPSASVAAAIGALPGEQKVATSKPSPTVEPPAASATAPPVVEKVFPDGFQLPSEVARGQAVSVPVQNIDPGAAVSVVLNDAKQDYRANGKLKDGEVHFTLPSDVKGGRYTIRIVVGDKSSLVPGELRVARDEQVKPVISGVSSPVYPSDGSDHYSFRIFGDHFGNELDTRVNVLSHVLGHDPITAEITPCDAKATTQCITVRSSWIDVHGFSPDKFEGPTSVSLQVGSLLSAPMPLTFSHFGIDTVRAIAILVTAAIGGFVYLLVRRGVGEYRVGSEQYSAFGMFIIDKDTHSYSLSKLQLLVWTAAAVFAYVYFFLCHVLIQWQIDFPDVPGGIPTLLGVSLGTTVSAAGLTATRGPKGAGPQSPSAADFVSAGGVVVPERFQFFVWTIVGVLGFVALVLQIDPALLSTLPRIPDNFLVMMGVSSVGYLAGKTVRALGPVISRVDPSITSTPKQLILKVDGQNMEEKATVRIDKKDYHPPVDESQKTPQKGTDYFTHLEWTIPWESSFESPTHVIEVVNSDGQAATSDFTLNNLAITNASQLEASKNEQELVVSVKNAIGAISAEWTAPGSTTAVVIPPDRIRTLGDDVTIRLVPGETPGMGRIALDNRGQRALFSVKVAATVPTTEPAPA